MTEQEALDILERLRSTEAACVRAEARLDAAEEELKRLGFDSIEEAEAHITKARKKKRALSTKLSAAVSEFMKKYAEALE